VRSKPRPGLTIAGALVTAGFHLPAVFVGALLAKSNPANMVTAVPVAGPLVAAFRGDSESFLLSVPFAVIDTVGQVTGLGLLLAGSWSSRKEVPVRNDIALVPVPMAMGKAGAGLGLAGTF
jgi:hypothetical protein